MIVLYAYGQILSKPLLAIPPLGCINVHASLLPHHRGASPIQQALLENDEQTGISLMKMVEKMDAGPVYKKVELSINPEDDAPLLTEKLANLSANETPNILAHIVNGDLEASPQNEEEASYCQKISKADGLIDWNENAKSIAVQGPGYAGHPTQTAWT